MDIKISIIIPAYNVEGYIKPCLDSIINQTFKEFEIIIINDGSTDKTPEICDYYANKDSRITVVHKKNEGVSIARNIGIDIAVGEYILFFDGDDFVEPYTCEELYAIIKEKQVDTLIYGYYRYDCGKVTQTSLPIFEEGKYEKPDIISKLMSCFIGFSCEGINRWLSNDKTGLYVENPALWRSMVSRKIIKDNNILFDKNLKVGEDTVFTSEYLSYSNCCYVHHKCYYYLVTRSTSTIYQYEKNALAKLEGKEKLLVARNELTLKIQNRLGIDISQYWQGTVVMSCIELAFLLSKSNKNYTYNKRYKDFLRYANLAEVKNAIKDFKPSKILSIKAIPLQMLRFGMLKTLFFCTFILNIINYKFERN